MGSGDRHIFTRSWYEDCRRIENILGNLDKPISLSLVRQIIESTKNNSETRKRTLNGLAGLLKYFNIGDYKSVIKDYKASNKIKRKIRNVPSDKRIIEVYQNGFIPNKYCKKANLYRYPQWQFLYGLLATYGLRIHEAWNIANWNKPVTLKNGDWVTVDVDDDTEESIQYSGEGRVIPAILDSDNKYHILCIKHATKTGYRTAAPLSPEGHNWIEEFNLLQPLNLPDVPNPLIKTKKGKGSYPCTKNTDYWFNIHDYGFMPHDLRHAYNHRGHRLGFNHDALCQSLGHGYQMNITTYRNSKSEQVKYQNLQNAINKEQEKRSENELLKQENKALKSKLEALKTENELLKTKLHLNTVFKESKG